MKELRIIRISLAVLFFLGSAAYLAIGFSVRHALKFVELFQIIPSAITFSLGSIIVWFVITLFIGRFYCATVCPVGTLQDIMSKGRKLIKPLNKPFSYRPGSKMRYYILGAYIFCIIAGVAAVPFWIEPWSIFRNICGDIHPSAEKFEWIRAGVGVASGIVAGVVSFILLLVVALLTGRGFCTDICPVGTALGCLSTYTLYHIEIDPDKCINCMRCEDICPSQCIKVSTRHVDNSRCIRCLDCCHVCPNDAIRLQANRNKRINPLMNPT
ncbi:MAG: 4Fe-4S binding protein [Muribaculaceae bacterium]|nr:4Fe-4S binding protein [Muribaculaceae bacterium]